MFIYAYARAKLWRMWRYIEHNQWGTVVYCDTDSLAIDAKRNPSTGRIYNISSKLKDHIGSEMGQLKIEMSDSEATIAMPKVYAMKSQDGQERIRAKGVGPNVRVIMLPNEPNSLRIVKDLRDGT